MWMGVRVRMVFFRVVIRMRMRVVIHGVRVRMTMLIRMRVAVVIHGMRMRMTLITRMRMGVVIYCGMRMRMSPSLMRMF